MQISPESTLDDRYHIQKPHLGVVCAIIKDFRTE